MWLIRKITQVKITREYYFVKVIIITNNFNNYNFFGKILKKEV